MLPLVLVACSKPAPSDTGATVGDTLTPTTDTDTDTEVPTEITGDDPPVASCAATDNALRFACTSSGTDPAWTVSEGAEVVRTFAGSDVVLWGLAADTTFTWSVSTAGGSASGQLTTGSLPSDLDDLDITVTGTPAEVEAVAFPQTCGFSTYGLVLDGAGRVVWYETVSSGGGGITAYAWTERDTFLAVTGGDEVAEYAATGGALLTVGGFDRPLHHAIHRAGDRIYVLNADEHDGRVVDGFYVLDDAGATVAEWDLADHVTVIGGDGGFDPFWADQFPGADDWSHGNSIWSDGSDAMISLRWQDAVISLDGDPDSATFGAIDWILTGTSDTDLDGDFAWTDSGGFDGQHHATPTEGGLTVFDNRAMNQDSRALVVEIDASYGTAREAASWSLGRHCDIQGGAFALAGGGMLATCANDGYMAEFAADEALPVWTLTASCVGGGMGPPAVAKAFPVALD